MGEEDATEDEDEGEDEEYTFPTSSCGASWEDAESCGRLCLGGNGCPGGQSCFVGIMCPASQVADAMGPAGPLILETVNPTDEIRDNTDAMSVCGADYADAEAKCRAGGGGGGGGGGDGDLGTFGFADDFAECPSGTDGECPGGQHCYGGVMCPIPPTTTTTTTTTAATTTAAATSATPAGGAGPTTDDGRGSPASAVEGSEPSSSSSAAAEEEPTVLVRGDKTEVVGAPALPPAAVPPAAAPSPSSSSNNASPYTIDVSTLDSVSSPVAAESCGGGCPPDSSCVGSSASGQLVLDDECAPCATGQTWWPCDVGSACWCWTDGSDRVSPAPGSGIDDEMSSSSSSSENERRYTVCDDVLSRETFDAIAPDANEPYTYEGLCDAILSYNARHDEKAFGMGNVYQRSAELAAFLGNTLHESDELRAGREYLMCGDNVVSGEGEVYCKPCDSGSFDWDLKKCNGNGLVSGGTEFNEYCQPTSGPPEACGCGGGVGESGDLEGYVAAKHLFFGRGSIQLSWNYNYIGASIALTGSPDTFCDDPDLVATEGRYAWGAGIYFWMEHVKEGTTCHMESLSDGGDFGECCCWSELCRTA
jgi:hypothetical protein